MSDSDDGYDLLGDSGSDEPKESRKKSVATRLVELAETCYTLGCTHDGEPYAVPRVGPVIVRQLRGGRQSLRSELADAFYRESGAAPSQSALSDALTVLDGRAQRMEPTDLHLRVAEHGDALVIDLADATGRAIVVRSNGWEIVNIPPVMFRRTALTAPLPTPKTGADLATLWPHLNVREKYRPVVTAVLVCNLMARLAHPVVLITGEAGTGKTTATARLGSVIDPSPAQVRKSPRDVEAWTTAAAGSWVVPLDNLSSIPDWLSDALCRASTGDGDVRRRLYSDGDLHVVAFRRAVILNGIDVGALRGDLADRAVHLDLDRIKDTERRGEEDMAANWADDHSSVIGALLDLTVRVLAVLPTITLDMLPRMADFARVLAAVDEVLNTTGLAAYTGLAQELAEDAAQSEPVIGALTASIRTSWEGTSAELLATITPDPEHDELGRRRPVQPPKGWPRNARDLTGQMKRHAPILRQLGWTVGEKDRGSSRSKQLRWDLTPPPEQSSDGNGAADAADAANGQSSQVSGGAEGAASGAANGAATPRDAAPMPQGAATAATSAAAGRDAADIAARRPPGLTSANEDHAATAATAAPNTGQLLPTPLDRWLRSGEPIN